MRSGEMDEVGVAVAVAVVVVVVVVVSEMELEARRTWENVWAWVNSIRVAKTM